MRSTDGRLTAYRRLLLRVESSCLQHAEDQIHSCPGCLQGARKALKLFVVCRRTRTLLERFDSATDPELTECVLACRLAADGAAECLDHGTNDSFAKHQSLLRRCEDLTRFLLADVRARREQAFA